jgi:hypothetical protein
MATVFLWVVESGKIIPNYCSNFLYSSDTGGKNGTIQQHFNKAYDSVKMEVFYSIVIV